MGKFSELLRKEAEADHRAEASRLVGTDAPPKKSFSDHAADGEKTDIANREAEARDWLLLVNPEAATGPGATDKIGKKFDLTQDQVHKLIAEVKRSRKHDDSANDAPTNTGRFINRNRYF